MQMSTPEEDQPSAMPLVSSAPSLPRPWSQPLQDALKRFYNTDSFEEGMYLLICEYTKNYSSKNRQAEHQVSQVQFVVPETPRTLGKRNLSASDQLSPLSQDNHNSVEDSTLLSRKQKRRKYTPEEKKEVNETRKRRACQTCHNTHKKCRHRPQNEPPVGPNLGEVSTDFSSHRSSTIPALEESQILSHDFEPFLKNNQPDGSHLRGLFAEAITAAGKQVFGPNSQVSSLSSSANGFGHSVSQNHHMPWNPGESGSHPSSSLVHSETGLMLQDGYTRVLQLGSNEKIPGSEDIWGQMTVGTGFSTFPGFGN